MINLKDQQELISILNSAKFLGSQDASGDAYNLIEQGMTSFDTVKDTIRNKITEGAEVVQDDEGNIVIDDAWYIINKLF